MLYIGIGIFVFLFLPGLLVHIQALRYLKKIKEYSVLWRSLSPLSVLFTIFLALPVYSFALYYVFIMPPNTRAAGLKVASEKIRDEKVDVPLKLSVIYGLARVVRIDLDS